VERTLVAEALEASLGAIAIPLDKPARDLVNEECILTIQKEVELPSFGGWFRRRPVARRESGGHRLGSVEGNHALADSLGSVLQGLADIVDLECRVCLEDFIDGHAIGDHPDNGGDWHP
jgi:hypothetical protein